MKYFTSESGFTLIELLVTLGIIGILASTAVSNYSVWTEKSNDTVAQSDYRNLKTVLYDVLTDPNSPSTFVMRQQIGPLNLPIPMDSGNLSSAVEVDIFHRTTVRRNRKPATLTTMTVTHREGGKSYQYTETNGIITEQVINKS